MKSNQIKSKAPKSEVHKQTVARDFNARRTRATERHRDDDDDDDDDGTGRFKRTSASDRAIERVAVEDGKTTGETTRTVTC